MDDQQKIQEILDAYSRFQEAMKSLRSEKKKLLDDIRRRLDDARVAEMLKQLNQ